MNGEVKKHLVRLTGIRSRDFGALLVCYIWGIFRVGILDSVRKRR